MYLDTSEICGIGGNRISAIAVARQFGGGQGNFSGANLCARGYAVSTIGFELAKAKEYVEQQVSRTS